VLELLSKGLPYKEIADLLAVNIETVHCYYIYGELQVSSRTEAVVKYLGKRGEENSKLQHPSLISRWTKKLTA
jgi:DNA-binding NarL/FixJ family response regulator